MAAPSDGACHCDSFIAAAAMLGRMRARDLAWIVLCLPACGGDAEDQNGASARRDAARHAAAMAAPKLLVVGWDGAPWELLDPLRAQGQLPNLEALIRSGRTAVLESTVVPISSAAWVGSVTGKHPGKTGVYSFFNPKANSYEVELVSSLTNQATPVWRILAGNQVPSIVFGVPLTFPPEPLPGVMVSGMLSPLSADYAWPPGLADELRERGFVPDLDIWRDAQELSMPRLYEQVELKRSIVTEMLRERDWRFAMIVFKSFDVLGHRAYSAASNGPAAELARRLDDVLGSLVEAAGEEVNVIVMSDHGFASYARAFYPHAWLLEQGFARRRPDARPVPPMNAPLEQRLANEHRDRIAELDLAATRALVSASEGNFGSIRLNLRGREPQGCVAAADADQLLAEIEAALRATRIQGTAQPLVRQVWRGRELYPGPHEELLPDLLFEVDPRVVVYPFSTPGSQNRAPNPMPDHSRDGILIASGPSIQRKSIRSQASIFDLAPFALHLLGQPIYEQMDGVVPTDWLKDGRAPEVWKESEDPVLRDSNWSGPLPFSDAERREVIERLGELGYTE